MVDAIEIYKLIEVSGRWDVDITDVTVDYFKRRSDAEKEKKQLEREYKQAKKKGETWDDTFYKIEPKLVRPEDLKRYGIEYQERPNNFVHLEDVESIDDVCGSIKELFATDNVSVSYVKLKGKAKPHKHKVMEEIYFILRGEGYLSIGDDVFDKYDKYKVEPGDTINIPKNKYHHLESADKKGLEVLVITNPKFMPSDVIKYKEIKSIEKVFE
ncbi:cupin domain-containing protein [Nanoarchaeota archaeon]